MHNARQTRPFYFQYRRIKGLAVPVSRGLTDSESCRWLYESDTKISDRESRQDSGIRNHNRHVIFCIFPYIDNKSPYIDIHVISVA